MRRRGGAWIDLQPATSPALARSTPSSCSVDDGVTRCQEPWQWGDDFAGETVVLIGNGPSLAMVAPEAVKGHRLIAINSACRWAAPVAGPTDMLLFNDNSWHENHQDLAAAWPGVIVTSNRYAAARLAPRARRLDVIALTIAVRVHPDATHASSGHTAAALAAAMGARRVVLLGFDGGPRGGRSHWHDDYREADTAVYQDRMLPGWRDLVPGLARMGCEVINATPGSSIDAAPIVPLADALGAGTLEALP